MSNRADLKRAGGTRSHWKPPSARHLMTKTRLESGVFEPLLLAARSGDAALYLLAQVAFRLSSG
jgi:hypothetical protein